MDNVGTRPQRSVLERRPSYREFSYSEMTEKLNAGTNTRVQFNKTFTGVVYEFSYWFSTFETIAILVKVL